MLVGSLARQVGAGLLAAVLGLSAWGALAARGQAPAPGGADPGEDAGRRPALPAPPARSLIRTPARDLTISKLGQAAAAPKGADKAAPADGKGEVDVPAAPLPPPAPAADPMLNMPLIPTPRLTPQAVPYIKQVHGPDNVPEVIVGRLQIFNLLQQPKRIQIGDDSVANYALLSPSELSLQGLRGGSTVLNVWFTDPVDANKSKLVGFLVRVLPDPDARDRLERAYKNLEREINHSFPDSKIHLHLVGDKLVVSGQAKDIADANMIMRVVQANILPETADAPNLGQPASADPAARYNRVIPAFHRQVVNMMRVVGEQ